MCVQLATKDSEFEFLWLGGCKGACRREAGAGAGSGVGEEMLPSSEPSRNSLLIPTVLFLPRCQGIRQNAVWPGVGSRRWWVCCGPQAPILPSPKEQAPENPRKCGSQMQALPPDSAGDLQALLP